MSQEKPSYEELLAQLSELKKHNEELARVNTELSGLAYYDALTSIMNRHAFDEALSRTASTLFRIFKTNRRVGGHLPLLGTDICLIGFDLDYFKEMNDKHRDKHVAGDRALKAFAGLLKQTFQRPRDIIARIGGDEFAAILPETSLEQATSLCAKLQVKMLDEESFFIQKNLRITTSIGITTFAVTNHSSSNLDIISEARRRLEHALYEAKENGRDTICSRTYAILQAVSNHQEVA